jgi:excisionase family DNA binding protein
MSDEILTLPEVAELLKVAEKTVYTMAQKGHLPAFKVGGQWRFRRDDLHRWIDARTHHGRPGEARSK